MGAPLVFSCCKHVYHRDELQSHAKLCWLLPSMTSTSSTVVSLARLLLKNDYRFSFQTNFAIFVYGT